MTEGGSHMAGRRRSNSNRVAREVMKAVARGVMREGEGWGEEETGGMTGAERAVLEPAVANTSDSSFATTE